MLLSKKIKFSMIILIILNLTMCFCVIWAFVRMAPIIQTIVEQNASSIVACEKMLSSLALSSDNGQENRKLIERFKIDLKTAERSITESDENIHVAQIKEKYNEAFNGNFESKIAVVDAINMINSINWGVISKADAQVKRLGFAGAWGVAFMSSLVFFLSMLFYFRLKYQLLQPVEEIYNVINYVKGGEMKRRCSGYNLPYDMKLIHSGINELLDKNYILHSKNNYGKS